MYKKLLTSITALTLVAGVGLIASPEQTVATGDFELTILHTNDTHANVEAVAKTCNACKPNSSRTYK